MAKNKNKEKDNPREINNNRNLFTRWIILFSLVILGFVVAGIYGMFGMLYRADVTKLSFIILLLFIYHSLSVGKVCYKYDKYNDDLDRLAISRAWSASHLYMSLGMIGTVVGFIYMLAVSFSTMQAGNIATLQAGLRIMGIGMATALYTTAAGLICGTLLQLQLGRVTEIRDLIYYADNDNSKT